MIAHAWKRTCPGLTLTNGAGVSVGAKSLGMIRNERACESPVLLEKNKQIPPIYAKNENGSVSLPKCFGRNESSSVFSGTFYTENTPTLCFGCDTARLGTVPPPPAEPCHPKHMERHFVPTSC